MTKIRSLISTLLVFSLISTSGCSLLESTSETSPGKPKKEKDISASHEETTVPIVPLSDKDKDNLNNIELLWQAAADSNPDSFIIKYGESQAALTKEIKVGIGEVDKFEDPSYGLVYRYVLRDVSPSSAKIYVSITAIQAQVVSEPSPVFEVEAAKQ